MAFSFITRFLGRTTSEAAGFALGGAMRRPVDPPLQELTNETWKAFVKAGVTLPLDAGDAAEIVAEDVKKDEWGKNQAAQMGIGGEQFESLVGAVLNAPGLSMLFELRRRGKISDDDLVHGFRKARMETRWDEDLKALLAVLLSPADLAMARQQGFVNETRQKSESALQGVDDDRAEILFEMSGLPPGVDVAQHAANRGFIDRATFDQIVREGHTKTKYTGLLWQLRNPLLSASTYVRLNLKGWITKAERNAGGDLWGYTPEQMEQWYLAEGRPAAPGQMATAAARGIVGPDGVPMDKAQFLKGIKESDIRPEWGEMLWGSRFLYPPLFQLTRLVQGGAIDADTAAKWAQYDRYPPEVVDALKAYWSQGTTGTTVDAREKLATSQAVASLKRRFMAELIDSGGVLSGLELLGLAADTSGRILETWTVEKGWTEKLLTPANIKKAYSENTYTQAEAIDALVQQHRYSPGDAQTFLTL